MKPWEETWRWDAERRQITTGVLDLDAEDSGGWRVIVETDMGCYPPREDERRLIVQAPAMARLLLKLARHVAPGSLAATCGHEEHDELQAVLRAAGVIE